MRKAERRHWLDALSPQELRELLALHDLRSWTSLAVNWGLVFGSFALVGAVPHPLTVLVALFVIGGRQLGCAVLMHEASHRTLLRRRALNDWVGDWLCAYPVWAAMKPYRRYHLRHHAHTWTEQDPDLDLARPFPVTRASLARKVWRDLSGRTGWKRVRAILRRDFGRSQGKTSRRSEVGWRTLVPVVVTNAAILAPLWAFGWPELYLLWPVAWMTTYSLAMRIRAIAEHSMPGDPADELLNARTTEASLWERALLAPNRVNFHLEHHLIMAVPHYHLPRLRRLLLERGVLEHVPRTPGYVALLSRASSA